MSQLAALREFDTHCRSKREVEFAGDPNKDHGEQKRFLLSQLAADKDLHHSGNVNFLFHNFPSKTTKDLFMIRFQAEGAKRRVTHWWANSKTTARNILTTLL